MAVAARDEVQVVARGGRQRGAERAFAGVRDGAGRQRGVTVRVVAVLRVAEERRRDLSREAGATRRDRRLDEAAVRGRRIGLEGTERPKARVMQAVIENARDER